MTDAHRYKKFNVSLPLGLEFKTALACAPRCAKHSSALITSPSKQASNNSLTKKKKEFSVSNHEHMKTDFFQFPVELVAVIRFHSESFQRNQLDD